jgi:tetratricopeptide (TPR) repeat protein
MTDLESTSSGSGGIAAIKTLYDAGRWELFVALAEAMRGAGDLEGARRVLEKGIKRDAQRISAWVLMARLSAQMGELEKARECYRKVLYELDPFNLPALRALTDAAIEAKDLLLAQDYLRRWRQEDPEDPELADFLEEMHEEVEALQKEGGTSGTGAEGYRVQDLSLAELERDVMPAPSVRDGTAWREEGGAAKPERKES